MKLKNSFDKNSFLIADRRFFNLVLSFGLSSHDEPQMPASSQQEYIEKEKHFDNFVCTIPKKPNQ